MTRKQPSIPADDDTTVQPGRRYDEAARDFSESARVEPASDEPFPGSKEQQRESARSEAAHERERSQVEPARPAGERGKTSGG